MVNSYLLHLEQPADKDMPATFYEPNPTYKDRLKADRRLNLPAARRPAFPAGMQPAIELVNNHPASQCLIVVSRGELLLERYFHGAMPNHANNVHSVSKGMLGAAVGIAIERGILRGVDEPLGRLLPQYDLGSGSKHKITLAQLLTMTAGFEWTEDQTESLIERQPDWVQAILDLDQQHAPGRSFTYSSGVSHLISAILAKQSGMSTRAFCEKFLFHPLDITVDHWGRDPQGIDSGGFNLYITPREVALFGLMVLNEGRHDGRQIVPKWWLRESLSRQVRVENSYHYGYLWWITSIQGREILKQWGYGGQYLYLIPSLDALVVITAQTAGRHVELDGDDILELVVPVLE